MKDEDIINYLSKFKLIKWSLLPKEITEYLYNKYNDFSSTEKIDILKESYYRILNKIDVCPICPICGNKLAFRGKLYLKTCGSQKCLAKECQIRRQETFFKKYGLKSNFSRYDVKEKIKKVNLEKYGVDNPWKLKEIQNKCKNTIIKNNDGMGAASNKIKEKMKQTNLLRYGYVHNWQDPDEQKRSHSAKAKQKQRQTCLKKYGVEVSTQAEIVKQHRRKNCLKKYGVTHEMKLSKFVDNINNVKRKNHTFNTSKSEKESYKLLKEKFTDIKYQYKSELYPYLSDFYIPSLDLYIECNYHWTHGGHPYNQENTEDNLILEKWKQKNTEYYNNAINTWVNRDPLKRKIAKQNNLNYLEFFTILEFENWLNNYESK